jgi:hypothetical protein
MRSAFLSFRVSTAPSSRHERPARVVLRPVPTVPPFVPLRRQSRPPTRSARPLPLQFIVRSDHRGTGIGDVLLDWSGYRTELAGRLCLAAPRPLARQH